MRQFAAAAALFGVALAAVPKTARGTLLTTTTSVSGTVVVAAVAVIIYLIVKKPKPKDDESALTRSLIDAGVMTVRGDLGTELSLLVSSPLAHEQLSEELARGEGPGVFALSRATGVQPTELAKQWQASTEEIGTIEDTATATRFAADFLARIAPQISVEPDVQSTLLWQLQRERLDPSFPESATAHVWLSRWLGVPLPAVVQATESAMRDLDRRSELDQRVALSERSEGYLDAIAAHIAAHHEREVSEKVAALVAQASPWLPAHLSDEIAALSGT